MAMYVHLSSHKFIPYINIFNINLPGWGRSSGEENGNPLQHSCLENPMDGGA